MDDGEQYIIQEAGDVFAIDEPATRAEVNRILGELLNGGPKSRQSLIAIWNTTGSHTYVRVISENVVERATDFMMTSSPLEFLPRVAESLSAFILTYRLIVIQPAPEHDTSTEETE